jgi:hypothetical protein
MARGAASEGEIRGAKPVNGHVATREPCLIAAIERLPGDRARGDYGDIKVRGPSAEGGDDFGQVAPDKRLSAYEFQLSDAGIKRRPEELDPGRRLQATFGPGLRGVALHVAIVAGERASRRDDDAEIAAQVDG